MTGMHDGTPQQILSLLLFFKIERKETSMTEPANVEKRLKFSEPDLTVIVGNNGKSFRHYSVQLASQSPYIDALLASSMKESETMTISFPEVEEEDWLLMIQFLELYHEDEGASRQMSADEAIKFAPFYNKYNFPRGLSLCRSVLKTSILSASYDLDFRVEIFELADQLEMKGDLYDACVQFFVIRLGNHNFRFGAPNELSLDHLRRLAPMVAKAPCLLDIAYATKEEVLSPLWPKFFAARKLLSGPDFLHISCIHRQKVEQIFGS